jgi:lipopolysaccharide biosynthesis glycosyltransferase
MEDSMNRIFIGYDTREAIAYHVLKYSLEKHSTEPLDIRPLMLSELDFDRPLDPLQTTEFTYTRFLVPWLCAYQGTAIFMDCDMLALGDISEIFRLGLGDDALRVYKHQYTPTSTIKMDGKPQTQFPRKNWSSFMYLNCARLGAWTKEAVSTQSGRWLHRFEPIADDQIGDIPEGWNVLDRYDANTRLIHYTEGGPWFENYRDHPYGDVWLRARDEYLAREAARPTDQEDRYLRANAAPSSAVRS